MDKFLYLTDSQICNNIKDSGLIKSDSDYVKKYNETVIKTLAKDNWKYSGSSAQFQQRQQTEKPTISANISGLCKYSETEYIYSVYVNDVSAILKKNYETGAEQYLIHSNKQIFKSVEYNENENQIVVAVADNNQTSNIATFDIQRSDLNILTSGDAVDDYPSYSKKDGSILFNSRGVGRNQHLEKIGEGNSSIYKISSGYFSSCDEIMNEENFDLIMPKEDKDGNLYYIRKPYKMTKIKNMSFADLILFPFRLFYNLFRFLFFLSQIGSKSKKKDTTQSSGDNPSVTPAASERDLYIMNEKINISKEEKANAKKGDKTPGYAPHSFELYKKAINGEKTKIKSGVLSYDIDKDGRIIFSNGKYIIKIDENGETVLSKDNMITAIKSV